MIGKKVFAPKLHYQFSLEAMVPKDHFLRQVDKVLDLRFVRKFVKQYYGTTGNPSIDPVVLIKMMLIGFFYNITSERQLAEQIQLNLAYRWYVGYDIDESTPHHSVISKARTRFGPQVFAEIFQHIVRLCIDAGLVEGDRLLIDATLVAADASLDSLVDIRYTPKEFVHQLFQDNPVPSKRTNDRVKSSTDPEATVVSSRNNKTQLAYKAHLGVDGGKHRIITSAIATSGIKADEHLLAPIVEEQEKLNLRYREVGADTKYGKADNYKFLLDKAIKPAIPSQITPNADKYFTLDEFKYHPQSDSYSCPAGKILKYRGYNRQEKRYMYKASKKECGTCQLKYKCCKAATRTVTRHQYHKYIQQAKEHLNSSSARKTLRLRKVISEGVNAEAKDNHCLRRAKCRGLSKMQIQLWLTACAINLKRLVKVTKRSKNVAIAKTKQPKLALPMNFFRYSYQCIIEILGLYDPFAYEVTK